VRLGDKKVGALITKLGFDDINIDIIYDEHIKYCAFAFYRFKVKRWVASN